MPREPTPVVTPTRRCPKCDKFELLAQDWTDDNQTLARTSASIAAPVRLELSVTGAIASKNSGQGFALDPRGKEVKFQGVTSVLPTRKPRLLPRRPAVNQLRSAVRRLRGTRPQEPPRTTRVLQFPLVHAEPSLGAPL